VLCRNTLVRVAWSIAIVLVNNAGLLVQIQLCDTELATLVFPINTGLADCLASGMPTSISAFDL
ncbi:hypothetical protein HAX54_033877, partial [Datura stramonium]|nr:hypothetical protein [Datura stramonium]